MKKRIGAFLRDSWLQLKENWWGVILGAFLSVMVGVLIFESKVGQKVVARSYDIPFAYRPNIPADEVVLVYLDEPSERVLEQPYNAPWDRRLHADLLMRMKKENAKAVVFDIVFAQPYPATNGAEIDEEFARAIKEYGKAVLAVDYVPVSTGIGQLANQRVYPYDPFEEGAAALGSAEMYPSDDLVIRQHLPESPKDDLFTLSWMTAEFLEANVTKNPRNHFSVERWMNYYGPDNHLAHCSLYQVIKRPKLVDNDILQIGPILDELKQPSNPASQFVSDQLSDTTLQMVFDYKPEADPNAVTSQVLDDFNRLIHGPSIYQEERFTGVKLADRTQALLAENLTGKEVYQLNRLLLEDIFRNNIIENVDPKSDPAPPGFFSNKVVFVGARTFTKSANERKDAYPTPYPEQQQGNKFMPGVEIQAITFLNLLREDWLNRLPRETEKSIFIAVGIFFGIALILCRPWLAGLVGIAGMAGVTFGNYYFFVHHRYWFPWLIVVFAQIPVAMVFSIAYNSIRLYVQKRLLEQSLAAYLSPKRVKQIKSKELLKPGAEKQLLTILFSDIESFTALSEGMDSGELAKVMNRYFDTAVTDCIFKTDGTVVKYIGDAIFAFWNAPEEQDDHNLRACEAALLLSSKIITYNKGGEDRKFRTRVGLHTGVANVGNFGSASRIDYTAIGENINLASRMEGLNKYLGTTVLITGDVKTGIGEKLVARFCGKFILKGFERAVEVHELVGMPESLASHKAWLDAFADALNRFGKSNFDEAEAGFRCVLQMKPDDGPSQFYLHEINELRTHPPKPGWQGEIELKEK